MASKGKRWADEHPRKEEMQRGDMLCPRSRSKSEPAPGRKPRAPNEVPEPLRHAEPLSYSQKTHAAVQRVFLRQADRI